MAGHEAFVKIAAIPLARATLEFVEEQLDEISRFCNGQKFTRSAANAQN